MPTLRVDIPELLIAETRRKLSPNGRAHWAQVAEAKQAVKMAAFYGTVHALNRKRGPADGTPITLSIDAAFANAARCDSDNIWAVCKSARDGIAAALRQSDDHNFRLGDVTLASRKAAHFVIGVAW